MGLFFTSKTVEEGNSYVIDDFPIAAFAAAISRNYGTSKLAKLFPAVGLSFLNSRVRKVRVHKFFVPELVYMLQKLKFPRKLINRIITETWMADMHALSFQNRADMTRIHDNMKVTLRDYQEEFIKNYDIRRQKTKLNGYLLSFDQGLGKTITALALMEALGKKTVIVIAPKSTIDSVWDYHVKTFFKKPKTICMIGRDELKASANYIIVNYEGMDKLDPLIAELKMKYQDVGIIVDESHNFLKTDALRTQNLITLRQVLKCHDILMMSGTPLKAVGLEIIPMLLILDHFFDKDALELFKSSFGVNTAIATDVLRSRLATMMYRKLKEEVITLPPKIEEIRKVKIEGGYKYTLPEVQKTVLAYTKERLAFHNDNMKDYVAAFTEVMEWVKTHSDIGGSPTFRQYLSNVAQMRKRPVMLMDPKDAEMVRWANAYEKDTLETVLPPDQLKKFRAVKSAVKYVHLKVRGEVIGNLLTNLRMTMTSAMVRNCGLDVIIDSALKKTVIFTSYVDTVETVVSLVKEMGYKPEAAYGKTSDDIPEAIKRFQTISDVNPMVASIQTLATGVTLTAANTLVFTNKPWRAADFMQSSDRIHRIGQDSPCYIISLVLDTANVDNLSTRMEDVMSWSKDLFEKMVGDAPVGV